MLTYEFDGMRSYIVKEEGVVIGNVLYNSYKEVFIASRFDNEGEIVLGSRSKWVDAYKLFNPKETV